MKLQSNKEVEKKRSNAIDQTNVRKMTRNVLEHF